MLLAHDIFDGNSTRIIHLHSIFATTNRDNASRPRERVELTTPIAQAYHCGEKEGKLSGLLGIFYHTTEIDWGIAGPHTPRSPTIMGQEVDWYDVKDIEARGSDEIVRSSSIHSIDIMLTLV